jgi:hypothetical protein
MAGKYIKESSFNDNHSNSYKNKIFVSLNNEMFNVIFMAKAFNLLLEN